MRLVTSCRIDQLFTEYGERGHPGAQIVDGGGADRGIAQIVERLLVLRQISPDRANHENAAGLDTAVAMLLRQYPAAFEVLDRHAHLTAPIVDIAQAAQRARLALAVLDRHGEFAGAAVMGEAFLDMAGGKRQRAEVVVYLGKLSIQLQALRDRRGVFQCCESSVAATEQAIARGYADPGSASRFVIFSHLGKRAKRRHGLLWLADFTQDGGLQLAQPHSVARPRCEGEPSRRQLERLLVAIKVRLPLGSV